MAKSNLKRMLALVLTALMIVGVLPMAIYGVDGTQELVENASTNTYKELYTLEELEEKLAKTGGELVLGQTFEEMTDSELVKGRVDSTTVGTGDVEIHLGQASAIVADPNGNGKVLAYKFSNTKKLSFNLHTQPNGDGKPDLENTGKSFVWSADIMLGDYWEASAFTFYSFQEDGVTDTRIAGKPLYLGSDGILYYGSKATAGNEIVELSKTEYTNIAVHVNVVDNKYDVYVNGEKVVSDITFLTDTELAKIDEEKLPNGFALSTANYYRASNAADAAGKTAFYLDNLAIYFNDRYLGVKGVVGENGEVYDDIQAAFDAASNGDTLTLMGDIEYEGDLAIVAQITLDLNGKNITADSFTVFADTITIEGAENSFIDVPKGQLSFGTEGITTEDTIVVYNEEAGRYEFAAVQAQHKIENNEIGDGFVFKFRPSLNNKTDYNKTIFRQGGAAANVKFVIRLEDADGNKLKEVTYSEELDKEYVAKAYDTDKALKVTFTGVTENHGVISVKYILESGTNMSCVIDAGTYTASTAPEAAE